MEGVGPAHLCFEIWKDDKKIDPAIGEIVGNG
jgi:hypothetical protein